MRENQEGPGKLNGVSSQLIRKDSAGLIDHFVGERRCGGDRPRPPRMQDGWKKDDGEGREEERKGAILKLCHAVGGEGGYPMRDKQY